VSPSTLEITGYTDQMLQARAKELAEESCHTVIVIAVQDA
jgi:hypothetical protein